MQYKYNELVNLILLINKSSLASKKFISILEAE